MRRLLVENADFRRLFLAHSVSRAGDAFNTVGLVVLVFDLTGSGLGVAGTVAFEVLPILLLGPLVGLAVDRFPRRSVMVVADLGRAGLAVLLAAAGDPVLVAYGVAFGLSALTQAFNPAASSTLPDTVEADELVDANTVLWTTAVVAQIVLAPLASVLIVVFATGLAFAINAASYLISAASLRSLRLAARRRPSYSKGGARPSKVSRSSVGILGSPGSQSSRCSRPSRPARRAPSWLCSPPSASTSGHRDSGPSGRHRGWCHPRAAPAAPLDPPTHAALAVRAVCRPGRRRLRHGSRLVNSGGRVGAHSGVWELVPVRRLHHAHAAHAWRWDGPQSARRAGAAEPDASEGCRRRGEWTTIDEGRCSRARHPSAEPLDHAGLVRRLDRSHAFFYRPTGQVERPLVDLSQVATEIRAGEVAKITVQGDALLVKRTDGGEQHSHKEPPVSVTEALTNPGVPRPQPRQAAPRLPTPVRHARTSSGLILIPVAHGLPTVIPDCQPRHRDRPAASRRCTRPP